MDAKRAAEVLRYESHWASETEATACTLGAQALEAWAWVSERQALVSRQHGRWLCAVGLDLYAAGPTPLAAVLDAMEKEGKG